MTLQEVGRICDALKAEGRVEIDPVYKKMEDGTATDDERHEFTAWLNHERGILCAENAILKAMYKEETGKS